MSESKFDKSAREAARRRCEAATKGPWERYGLIGIAGLTRVRAISHLDKTGRAIYRDVPNTEDDATLIAHARTDLPAALDEIDRLETELVAVTAERDRLLAVVKSIATCKPDWRENDVMFWERLQRKAAEAAGGWK